MSSQIPHPDEVYRNPDKQSDLKKPKSNSNSSETGKRPKIADILIGIALDSCELFLDQNDEPHVILPDRPIVAYSVKSRAFQHWLAGIYWEQEKTGFGKSSFEQVVSALSGKARHENNKIQLYNRIAIVGGEIFYDIGDNQHVVHITKNIKKKWEIKQSSGVIFRRFNHQKEQVKPKRGGNLKDVLKFVNLKHDSDKLLLITYLVAVMFPDIPRVIIIVIGDQGSAKSTLLRILRSLVDPSRTELLKMRSSGEELAQMADHNYCLYLDNLSFLSSSSSDSLAGFVTGLGFNKRKLYSDSDDIIFEIKVAVGITGINLVAEKADLLDRCLIFVLNRIPDTKWKEETVFWKEFDKKKPYILGALFDVLSDVLRTKSKTKLHPKPRMSDYAVIAATAGKVLGYSTKEFSKAYRKNVERQNQAAVDSSPVAQTIIEFMTDKSEWKGASSELFEHLEKIAKRNKFQLGGQGGFPKSPTWLWRKINLVKTNLLALGVKVSIRREASHNTIELVKTSSEQPLSSQNDSSAPNKTSYSTNGSMETVGAKSEQKECEDADAFIKQLEKEKEENLN